VQGSLAMSGTHKLGSEAQEKSGSAHGEGEAIGSFGLAETSAGSPANMNLRAGLHS